MKITHALLALTLSLASLPIAHATVQIGLVNGDFESPAIPASPGIVDYSIGNPPPASFGWQLAGGAIDLTSYWQAASGQQSLDLTGDWGSDPGVIYQDFAFSHAGSWAISFGLSANPDSPYPDFPTDRTIQIDFGTAGGSLTSLGTWTVSAIGNSWANMNWVTFTTPAINIQNAVIYRLEISSLSPSPYGPVLDNVQLVTVPEPSALALAGLGAAALMNLRRRGCRMLGNPVRSDPATP